MGGETLEGTRKIDEALVVYTRPDVCKSPVAPVPYPIVAKFSPAFNVATTVNSTSVPTFTQISRIQGVQGDEGGAGLGVKSGTHAGGGVCEPTGWSPSVNAEGKPVVRHTDPFLMNTGNTTGKVVYQKDGKPRGKPDENGEPPKEANPPTEAAPKSEGGFVKGVTDRGGEILGGLKDTGKTLWDATGLTATPEATAAARGALADSARGTASAVGDAVRSPFDSDAWARTQGRVSNEWNEFKGGYEQAYAEGGLGQAIGRGATDIGSMLVGGAAAKAGTKALGTVGRKVLKKAPHEGDGNVRVTEKEKKPDEKKKKKTKEEELEEQRKAVKEGDFKAKDDPAFWTGEGARDAAERSGASTLNDTPGGRALGEWDNANAGNVDWADRRPLWEDASRNYANSVADRYGIGGPLEGQPVRAFVGSENPGNIFRSVEEPILRARGVNVQIIPAH